MARIKSRCILALNALDQLIDGTQFVQHPVRQKEQERSYNMLYHLQAISVMLSGGVLYNKNSIINSAQKLVNELKALEFEVPSGLTIVHQGKSLVTWNAMAAIIYFKLDEKDKAQKYINTIKSCISEKSIKASLLHPVESGTPIDLGIILLSLLKAYQYGGELDQEILDTAKLVGNRICGSPMQLSGYDAWGLRFLSIFSGSEFYSKRQRLMAQSVVNITVTAMTSLFVAVTQQVLLSEGQEKKELLKQQLSLQVTPNNLKKFPGLEKYVGNFVRKKGYQEIRIDYTIQNILSMLQYDIAPCLSTVI